MEATGLGVLGAGQMGSGIAQVAALAGYHVTLVDREIAFCQKAIASIEKSLAKGIEKGKLTEAQRDAARANLKSGNELKALADCHLVIEAATESLELKLNLFRKLSECVGPSAILATNTSSISITQIASQVSNPERVVGLHFMNPVPVMKLVEGIRGLQTSDATFSAVRLAAQKMGKTFIESKDSPGFVVNRILMPMINEAIFALQEGLASPADIDQAMVLGTNQPMGPLALADFIGLDTCLAILEVLHRGLGDPKYRPCPLLKNYVAAGWFGKKTGRGFYVY